MEARRPAEVFHPGEYLLDELDTRGWTQTEFAEIIGRPFRLVNEIINGKRGITPSTAREFSAALGTSAELWMNLDTAYHLWKTTEDVSPIVHRAKMRSKFPVRDMLLRNWLEHSEDTEVIESQLLRYFEVRTLDETPHFAHAIAAKRSASDTEELTPIQLAWLYRVKHIAETMKVPHYSQKRCKAALEQLRSYREYPEDLRHVPELLERVGIRFVVVGPLPSSKIDGVCLWLNESPVIGMTLRFDRIDNFWFVLRHEVEHVLNGDGKDIAILDSDLIVGEEDEGLPQRERVANSAAAEFCVPQSEMDDFIARKGPRYSRKDVVNFARRLNVHPGLVAGQLQWKTKRFDLFRSMLVPIRNEVTSIAMTDGYGHFLPTLI